jgi:hypothetical protein
LNSPGNKQAWNRKGFTTQASQYVERKIYGFFARRSYVCFSFCVNLRFSSYEVERVLALETVSVNALVRACAIAARLAPLATRRAPAKNEAQRVHAAS